MKTNLIVRFCHVLFIFVLAGVLIAAYYQQYAKHVMPCPLCILQRLGMIGVGLGILMNVRFGVQAQHYAFSLLSALFGAAVSLRHIFLHICSGPKGVIVFGWSLYTWAFLVFCCSIFTLACLLFAPLPKERICVKLNLLEKCSFGIFFLLIVANCITTFSECGLGICPDVF